MVEFDVKMERFRDKETGLLVSGRMFKNMRHAAAAVRLTAQSLFRESRFVMKRVRGKNGRMRNKKAYIPSQPGRPPGRATGRLKRSIMYDADEANLTFSVGPRASVAAKVGRAHEFGGRYKGGSYDARPFMQPALEKNLHRLPSQFAGRVGG